MPTQLHYFLGSNSPAGFKSYFSQLDNLAEGSRLYIVKGGPGCGKSSLMRTCGEALLKKGEDIHWLHCSSDPDSLDGFIAPGAGVAMADGTAPHVMEPCAPGARESIISLYECLDEGILSRQADRICALFSDISTWHARAVTRLDIYRRLCETAQASLVLDTGALDDICNSLLSELPEGSFPASEQLRLLDAPSVGRVVAWTETLEALCPGRITLLEGNPWAASHILGKLAARARTLPGGVVRCPSAIFPELTAHVLIPALGAGYVTQTPAFPLRLKEELHLRTIDLAPCVLPSPDIHARSATQWQLDEADKWLRSACGCIRAAKTLHDALEAPYIESMNFDHKNAIALNVISAQSAWRDRFIASRGVRA
nr:hypothetical protein [bacterium]